MTAMVKDPEVTLQKRVGIYLFFLAHMAVFGFLTFYLSYHAQQGDMYGVGVIALLTYVPFYLMLFGVDEIVWLVITSVLGMLMIYSGLEMVATLFIPDPGSAADWQTTDFDKFPVGRHILPATFLVMFEFMLRNLVIDVLGARHDPRRNRIAGYAFLALSLGLILLAWFK